LKSMKLQSLTFAPLSRQEDPFLPQILKRIGSLEVAEDLLQSAYLKAFASGFPDGSTESVEEWFLALIGREIRNYHLRRSRSRICQIEADELDRLSMEDLAIAESPVQCIQEALRLLNRDEARLITWIDLQGRFKADAARALNMAPGSVTVLHARALAKLRILLQEQCHACRVTCCPHSTSGRASA
jgi:DNA-directed RNA polymerase specialized sigma24 family protein